MRRLLPLAAMLALWLGANTASASPGWVIKCPLSHTNMDDPIRFPGQPGAAHLHDFFGATTTDAFSTYASMTAGTTLCGTAADTAGYWVPALYRNAVKVNPAGSFNGRATRQQIYYREYPFSGTFTIEPFQPNFKMIQGYQHATSLADANLHGAKWGSEMYWGCSNNSPDGKFTSPVNCSTGIITLHIGFPSCWDGVMVDGDEIAAGHVVFPKSGACPAGFAHRLPRLIERFEWPVGTSSTGLTLSSGPLYTAHADFWNTWQQSRLVSLTTSCLNANIDCGTDP
jgi:hypothetical protein